MIVGLTGGIGSGKSCAGKFFQEVGIDVIDADNVEKNKMLEMMHKKKKQMNELGSGNMMRRRAGSGQTSAY